MERINVYGILSFCMPIGRGGISPVRRDCAELGVLHQKSSLNDSAKPRVGTDKAHMS